MEKLITATKAVREFSDILNSIKFKGDHYIIERGGKPIAYMKPFSPQKESKPLKELKSVLRKLPKLGEESEVFEKDLNNTRKDQPMLPNGDIWV